MCLRRANDAYIIAIGSKWHGMIPQACNLRFYVHPCTVKKEVNCKHNDAIEDDKKVCRLNDYDACKALPLLESPVKRAFSSSATQQVEGKEL